MEDDCSCCMNSIDEDDHFNIEMCKLCKSNDIENKEKE